MANNIIGAMFFFIMAAVSLLVYVTLPSFISSNDTYNLLFGFFPFLFTMIGLIAIFKN